MPACARWTAARSLDRQATAPASVSDAAALGERVAEELLARGAGELIARERGRFSGGGAMNARLADKAVVVTRAEASRRPARAAS